MVVGEIVSGSSSATNTAYSFQPAGSTQIIITSYSAYSKWPFLQVNGSVDQGLLFNQIQQAPSPALNTKICLDNTHYIAFEAVPSYRSFWNGIQIK